MNKARSRPKGPRTKVCARNFNSYIEHLLNLFEELPMGHNSPDGFAWNYLRKNLVRKRLAPGTCIQDLEQNTLNGFLARESVNRKINLTATYGFTAEAGWHSRHDRFEPNVFNDARVLISKILGPFDIEVFLDLVGLKNGASASLLRKRSQVERKLVFGRTVTPRFAGVARLLSASHVTAVSVLNDSVQPKRVQDWFKSVPGSVFGQVPKDSKVNRIIMQSPEVNGFYQKAMGAYIRNRLRQSVNGVQGINLNESGLVNSRLAREASIHGHLATIDTERASDSLSISLIQALLPDDWLFFLDLLREDFTLINGKMHRLSMFSGMGNSYTFELESLVFYALGRALCKYSELPFAEHFVGIHGDDLIIPSDVASMFGAVAWFCGLQPNSLKSFSSGKFRESCGGHFFDGHSVKPIYIRAQTGNTIGDHFWLANSITTWLNDRTTDFAKTQQCVKLVKLRNRILHDCTNGDPAKYFVPPILGPRAGVFCIDPPISKGSSYKIRANVAIVRSEGRLPVKGRYLSWLLEPRVSPSPLELLSQKPSEPGDYGSRDLTYERIRVRYVNTWSQNGVRGYAHSNSYLL